MRFAIFRFHLSKLLRLPRKSDTGSYEVLHLSRKIISANLKIWCSKMQPFSGNQRPDLLTDLMSMSLVLRLPRKMHLCRSHACHGFWKCYKTLTFCSLLATCRIPCTCHAKRHLNVKNCSGPLSFFYNFDFEMCFAPQQRALFQHLNFQKWSNPLVFLTFWLGNVLRATTACTFSTSQLPRVVRQWCVLYILTSTCASRIFAPQRRAIVHLSSAQRAPHPPL